MSVKRVSLFTCTFKEYRKCTETEISDTYRFPLGWKFMYDKEGIEHLCPKCALYALHNGYTCSKTEVNCIELCS